jgi:2,3-bisphosphoglycerate-dependent phosphoglycerate mutase
VSTPPRTILLLRHGETDANRDGIVQGHRPTPLNGLGHSQARLLARRIAAYVPRVEVLISSDLPRALQTALPIGTALGVLVSQDAAWRERSYGSFEGKNAAERAILRSQMCIGDGPPPDAQRPEDYQRQVLQALHGLPMRYPTARCLAVVTHAGAIRTIALALAAGDGVSHTEEYRTCPNCSITRLSCAGENGNTAFCLEKAYDVAHLSPEVVTSADSG